MSLSRSIARQAAKTNPEYNLTRALARYQKRVAWAEAKARHDAIMAAAEKAAARDLAEMEAKKHG